MTKPAAKWNYLAVGIAYVDGEIMTFDMPMAFEIPPTEKTLFVDAYFGDILDALTEFATEIMGEDPDIEQVMLLHNGAPYPMVVFNEAVFESIGADEAEEEDTTKKK